MIKKIAAFPSPLAPRFFIDVSPEYTGVNIAIRTHGGDWLDTDVSPKQLERLILALKTAYRIMKP